MCPGASVVSYVSRAVDDLDRYDDASGTKAVPLDEVLRILSEQAKNGSVTAAVALERALRTKPPAEENVDDELAHILGQ
jgi:hypothetical protein